MVGEALLSTLETALGDAWTPTVEEGWTAIYVFISTTMIKGAVHTLEGNDKNSAVSTAEQ